MTEFTLSEEFMLEFIDKINIDYICQYDELSEDFIKKCYHKVNWELVGLYQELSDDFVREFWDKSSSMEDNFKSLPDDEQYMIERNEILYTPTDDTDIFKAENTIINNAYPLEASVIICKCEY